jgi:hypothetical protein
LRTGGLRLGRERKAHAPCGCADQRLAKRADPGCLAGMVVVRLIFGVRPVRSQPQVFTRPIQAAPAPTALRNFRRVSFALEASFVPKLVTSLVRLVAGEHKQ